MMANFVFSKLLASMILTLSVFLMFPKVNLSHQVLPMCLVTVDGRYYIGVDGDAPNGKIRLIQSNVRSPQWFYKDMYILWERDHGYCLTVNCNTKKLLLKHGTEGAGKWFYDKHFHLKNSKCGDFAITRKGNDLFISRGQKSRDQRFYSFVHYVLYLRRYPTPKYPMPYDSWELFREFMRSQVNFLLPMTFLLAYPRDIARFPGIVSPQTPRVSRSVELRMDFQNAGKSKSNTWMTNPKPLQPTNLYVPAGEIIEVRLPQHFSLNDARGIILRVGAHNKVLTNKVFERMPLVTEHHFLFPGLNQIRSQYGGNLIFWFFSNKQLGASVRVRKVVEAPYYELDVTRPGEWNELKHKDAPHSVLVSKRCVIIGHTVQARRQSNPRGLLEKYDRNINFADDLAGFDDSDPPPPGRQWLTNGLMMEEPFVFGGFPIALDRRYINLMYMYSPDYMYMFLYIGLVYYQRIWEPVFGQIALANIFTLYMHEKVHRSRPFSDKYIDNVRSQVKHGKPYQEFNGNQRSIFFLDLIEEADDTNWEMFRYLHRRGRSMNRNEIRRLKKNPHDLMECAYYELSMGAKKDLFTVFRRWGFKVSQRKRKQFLDDVKNQRPDEKPSAGHTEEKPSAGHTEEKPEEGPSGRPPEEPEPVF